MGACHLTIISMKCVTRYWVLSIFIENLYYIILHSYIHLANDVIYTRHKKLKWKLISIIILLPIVASSHRNSNISYLFVVITSAPEIVPFLSTSGDCPSHFYKIKYLLFAKKVFSSFHIVLLYYVSNLFTHAIHR